MPIRTLCASHHAGWGGMGRYFRCGKDPGQSWTLTAAFPVSVPSGTRRPPLTTAPRRGEQLSPLRQADTWPGSGFLDRMAGRGRRLARRREGTGCAVGRAHPGHPPALGPRRSCRRSAGAAASSGPGNCTHLSAGAPRPPLQGRSRPPDIRDAPRGLGVGLGAWG